MKKFRELCEALEVTTIVQTKRLRYPKQINLSEEFLSSLKKEIIRHNTINESEELPITNFKEKFLKAIMFHLAEHCGHCGVGKKGMKGKKSKKSGKAKINEAVLSSSQKNLYKVVKNLY